MRMGTVVVYYRDTIKVSLENSLSLFCEFVYVSFFKAMCQGSSLKGEVHDEKMMISAFLARVMHGKQLGKLHSQKQLRPPS